MIEYYKKLRKVERLALQFTHRTYNLMEHQFMVAVLFKHFASKEDVSYGMAEFNLVLHHDIVETVTTDLIFPVKSLNEKTKQAWDIIEEEVVKAHPKLERYSDKSIKSGLTKRQHALFKACDYIDLLIFVQEEIDYGNKSKDIILVKENCLNLIGKISEEHHFTKIADFIKDEYSGK